MTLAVLFTPPDDDKAFAEFAFANADSHFRIRDAIRSEFGVSIIVPILDPIPEFDRDTWLQRHQQVHNEMNAELNIDGADLTQLDFNDRRQVFAWISQHAEEHREAENMLGIG